MVYHVGKILLDNKYLLKWLQYDGGKIHYIGKSEDYLGIAIVIEHPDMPEVSEGGMIPIVNPAYYWEDVYRVNPKMGFRTRFLRFWKKLKSESEVAPW